MQIQGLQSLELVDEGFKMFVENPDGSKAVVPGTAEQLFVMVRSVHSDAAKAARDRIKNERLKKLSRGTPVSLNTKVTDEEELDQLVACTASWNLPITENGTEVVFSEELVRMVYANRTFANLRTQVERAANQDANFTKG